MIHATPFVTLPRKLVSIMRNYFRQNPGELYFAFFLLALIILVRLPTLQPFLESDSGAIAYHARLINQGEPLYGNHHANHHLPGTFYTYAFIFRLLGDSPLSIKIALIPWVWLTAWLLYLVGKEMNGMWVGRWAAIFFSVTISMTFLSGDTGKVEMYGNLPLTLGIWLGLWLIKKRGHPAAYILIGVVGGIAFLYKALYLTGLGSMGVVILLDAILTRNRSAWIEFFQRGLAILIGLGIVFVPVVGYFMSQGLLARFLLVFSLGKTYMDMNQDLNVPVIYILLYPAILIWMMNPIYVVISGIHISRLLFNIPRMLNFNRAKGLTFVLLVTWLFGSLIETGILRQVAYHYGLVLIPPVSILAALELAAIKQSIAKSRNHLNWLPVLLAVLLIATTISINSKDYVVGYLQYLTGQVTLEQFVRTDTTSGPEKVDSMLTAQYLANHTTPSETIFLWSDQAQTYYFANRRASADLLWPFHLVSMGHPERVFISQPRYVVLGPINILAGDKFPTWLAQELASHYTYETTIGLNSLYRRKTP